MKNTNQLLPISLFIICSLVFTGKIFPNTTGSFITIKEINGKHFFIDTDGKPFLSIGVNHILPIDDTATFGSSSYNGLKNGKSINEWTDETASFLSGLGFNTIGSWSGFELSNKGFYYVVQLGYPGKNKLLNIFDPMFVDYIKRTFKDQCREFINSKNLLGYFIENDLHWYGDYPWYTGHSSMLFDEYMKLDKGSYGKKRLLLFLKEKYSSIYQLNRVWGSSYLTFDKLSDEKEIKLPRKILEELRSGFLKIIADYYYKTITKIIREIDPNHLIFTDRYANSVPEEVLEAAGKYCDVIALNYYKPGSTIDTNFLNALAFYSRKPVLITEFTIRAKENSSGLKNSKGVNNTVNTQKERAERYLNYAETFSKLPYIIGFHWFQFFDEPREGRYFDGEDSNYGIVDIEGRPYPELCEAMKNINTKSTEIHQNSKEKFPETAIPLDGKIRPLSKFKRKTVPPLFMDPASGERILVSFWGDMLSKATILSEREENKLTISFDTGNNFGLGIAIRPENIKYYKNGYMNIAGYKGMEIRLSLPLNTTFWIGINEAGMNIQEKEVRQGSGNFDGESFISDDLKGTGNLETYRLDFDSFSLSPFSGNQMGNKSIDLDGISKIDIFIPGKQGKGVLKIESIRFY